MWFTEMSEAGQFFLVLGAVVGLIGFLALTICLLFTFLDYGPYLRHKNRLADYFYQCKMFAQVKWDKPIPWGKDHLSHRDGHGVCTVTFWLFISFKLIGVFWLVWPVASVIGVGWLLKLIFMTHVGQLMICWSVGITATVYGISKGTEFILYLIGKMEDPFINSCDKARKLKQLVAEEGEK
jgi:hypothetical protein